VVTNLVSDVRFGLRTLWKGRAVTALAAACLAVGVGLSATMFSVVDGVLIQGLPYHDPERLIAVTGTNVKAGENFAGVSYPDFADIRDTAQAFEAVGLTHNRNMTVSDGAGEAERFLGGAVSWNLHQLLGKQPIHGRAFTPADDVPGAEPVVMLGHHIWTRRYQANPAIVNQRILVDGRPHTVIGVMPENFAFPEMQQLWVPIAPISAADARSVRGQELYARLRPGVTVDQAGAEMTALAAELAERYPDSNREWNLRTMTLREEFIPEDVRLVILLMMGGATLVLVIACANVANLLLARATVRRREIAIRASLGAGKGRIVRQLLTESALLGMVAVPLGLVIAQAGTALLRAGIPPDRIPYYIQWRVDWRTTLYTAAVAVGTAVLFGLMPALQAAAGSLHSSLKEGGRGGSGRRSWLRNALVTAEVALAVTALVAAMLFVRTFVALNRTDVGFDPAPLMTMRYYLPGEAYAEEGARARRARDIVERVERLPGVEAAFTSNFMPLGGGGGGGRVTIEGQAVDPERRRTIAFAGVSPGFVRTLGSRITAGRELTASEAWSQSPLAIVNETMAQDLFGGDALGRRFRVDGVDDWFMVAGVVTNIRNTSLDDTRDSRPAAYVPYAYQQLVSNALVIRVAGDPASITPAVRLAIRASDANVPMTLARPMDEVRRLTFWEYELFGSVFSTIGLLGLLLASVGVYGVLAYTVTQRQQEIGVMMALGAGRRDVMRIIVGQGLRLAGAGVVAGLAGAAAAGKAAQSLLINVSPFDPISFATVSVFLMIVALAASALPARRAMSVDPIIALRAD
jgi:predicted permease